MDLTPQTLHAVEFREARRGGYNTRDVDDFIERIVAAVGQLQDRLRDAAARSDAAEAHLQEAQRHIEDLQRRPPPAPPVVETSETDETLRRTLVLAQRTADATVKEAKQEANRMLEEARGEVDRLRSSADEVARAGVEDAREAAEAEVDALLETRDALQGDIETLRTHLEAQRDKIRASLDDLRSVVDDPDSFPLLDVPPTTEVDRGTLGAGHLAPAPDGGIDALPPQPERAPLPAREPGRNGRTTEPGPSPFVPGSQIAALQEPPSPSPTPFGGFAPPAPQGPQEPPAPPFGFGPDDRGPWMPAELRDPEAPHSAPAPPPGPLPPFAVDDDFGMTTEAAHPPPEWGRAVFGQEDEPGEPPYSRGD